MSSLVNSTAPAGTSSVRSPAFEARLHSFVTTKQKTALRFRSFFAPRTEVALHLRNVAVKRSFDPILREPIDRRLAA